MAWLLPCHYAVAQKINNDSLKAARQHSSDSLRKVLQQHTDSVRALRQHLIDSNRKVQQLRSDSLGRIRKYKESSRYKDSVTKARNAAMKAVRDARTAQIDSIKAIRKQTMDSTVAARKYLTDSLQAGIRRRSDSLNTLRKYRESKRYKDSVTRTRNTHIDSIRKVRNLYFDSVKTQRQQVLDSTMRVRKHLSDSMRQKQQLRADSLGRIRKYKESKRYRDSVSITRQNRLDSIRADRKAFSDSMISVRKHIADSSKAVRKQALDSMTAVRKRVMDSLKVIRDARADSLAKQKEQRLKNLKVQQKKREDKAKLAMEIKIKKKHEAYSNEKMLKKKWTLVRQGFQNTFTRYNYYYNARRKMTEAQQNMQRRKKDDFDQLLTLFPFDPNVDSTVFASDMDTIIRKASVGIQIHDPRTKWADDLYLLMGQSFYYKGNYEMATTTFKYVIGMRDGVYKKKKKKNTPLKKESGTLVQKEKSRIARLLQHEPAHNDAVLWLTRTFTDSDREADAEAILDLLDASARLSDRMKGRIALEKANLMVKRHSYKEAIRQLEQVAHTKAVPKYIRQRAAYLNGQLLYDMGEYTAAAGSFNDVLALHPQIDMDFYARKNMANSVALGGGDQRRSIAGLKKILKDGKYAPYHEQVYAILGQLSASEGRDDQALDYYSRSLKLPKTSKKQKAITFAAIGNIHYRQGQYNLAKRAYDSASYFSRHAPGNEELELALQRGKSLDKIEAPYNEVQTKDSLLRLSAMSDKEKRNVVRKYLKMLEQQKADSAANALAASGATAVSSTAGGPGGTASSWYFSSPVTIQQGVNDFKRKWGSRNLSDNWRRSSASFGSSAGNSGSGSDATGSDADDNSSEEGLSPEDALLAVIPKTEAQITATRQDLRKAYYLLADAYIKNLEDYPAGLNTLDTLDRRFPDHEYPGQVLALRYLAALRLNQQDEATQLRNRILSDYPDSEFGRSLREDTATVAEATDKGDVSEYYTQTYEMAGNRDYAEALQRSRAGQRNFGNPLYNRKFRILEAISLAGMGAYKQADTVISKYLKEFPSDSLKPWVDAVALRISELKKADTLVRTDSLLRSAADTGKLLLPGPGRSAADSVKAAALAIPEQYAYKAGEAHYCIFLFGKPDAKIAGFKSGLGDFSTFKYGSLNLSTNMELLGKDSTIVITQSFSNANGARVFLSAVRAEARLFRDIPAGSYQAFLISASNYRKFRKDHDLAAYKAFYSKYYR